MSAEKNDVHSVFAGWYTVISKYAPIPMENPSAHNLVLMTYYGVVLLMLDYQANEVHVVKPCEVLVSR